MFFKSKLLAPTPNTPIWSLGTSLCASFPGKLCQKSPTYAFFGGDVGLGKGVPNGSFCATKS